MALVDVRGFNLNSNPVQSFAQGANVGAQFSKFNREEQVRELLGQAITQNPSEQNNQLAIQSEGLGQDNAIVDKRQQLINQAKRLDPVFVQSQLQKLGMTDDLKRAEASRFASQLESVPFDQRAKRIQARATSLKAQGRDSSDTTELLDMTEDEQNQALTGIQLLDLSTQQRLSLKGKPSAKTTIKEGLDQFGKPRFFNVSGNQSTPIEGITPTVKQPLVSINNAASQTENKELAKIRAKGFSAISDKADLAQEQINSLDILDSIDVATGVSEPFKQAMANWGSAFGINTESLANVPAGQAYAAEAGKVVLRVLATQKGPQTDNDRTAIRKTISRLGNTPQANTFINDVARAQALRQIEQRDFFENYLSVNDSLKGATSSWNKKKRNVPMVSTFVKTQDGLPVFFFNFNNAVRQANPDATDEQITEAWVAQEDKARKENKK